MTPPDTHDVERCVRNASSQSNVRVHACRLVPLTLCLACCAALAEASSKKTLLQVLKLREEGDFPFLLWKDTAPQHFESTFGEYPQVTRTWPDRHP